MRSIAIINQKGGCGKTTTSINLAACLARLGQKTLLIDMDPQGHCGVGLAVPEEQIERTILDCLIEPSDGKVARLPELVWQIASEFDLAPSNIKLAAFEQLFSGRVGREDRLRHVVDSVRDIYQWVIIDCPPSVGLLTFNALRACDEALVPVETGYFSLHGLAKMMETLELMRERCSNEIEIRVLPTLYDTRTKLAREVLAELRGKFKDYLMESTVNFNTKLKEAASFGQPITEYDPGSRGYKDFVNLARELMGHRPVEADPISPEPMSRPAELVQRAKHLAQLTNFQFGRNVVQIASPASISPSVLTSAQTPPSPSIPTQGLMTTGATAMRQIASGEGSPMRTESLVSSSPMMSFVGHLTQGAKTTSEKIDEFYGVKQVDGRVVFAARFDSANNVLIAGDFNNWSSMATPLRSDEPKGVWTARLPLQPGRYRYRFIVDGQWVTDPHNSAVETNQFGELNNIVEVA